LGFVINTLLYRRIKFKEVIGAVDSFEAQKKLDKISNQKHKERQWILAFGLV